MIHNYGPTRHMLLQHTHFEILQTYYSEWATLCYNNKCSSQPKVDISTPAKSSVNLSDCPRQSFMHWLSIPNCFNLVLPPTISKTGKGIALVSFAPISFTKTSHLAAPNFKTIRNTTLKMLQNKVVSMLITLV